MFLTLTVDSFSHFLVFGRFVVVWVAVVCFVVVAVSVMLVACFLFAVASSWHFVVVVEVAAAFVAVFAFAAVLQLT